MAQHVPHAPQGHTTQMQVQPVAVHAYRAQRQQIFIQILLEQNWPLVHLLRAVPVAI